MDRRAFLGGVTAACATMLPSTSRALQRPKFLTQRTLDAPPRCVSLGAGRWTGFEIQLSTMLCKRVGLALQPFENHIVWSRALKMIETGDMDLLPNVTWRADRTKIMDFIGPCAVLEIFILVRIENAAVQIETLDDFVVDGRLYDYVVGAAIEPQFDQRLKNDAAFASHFIGSVSSASLHELGHIQALGNRVAKRRVFGAIVDWYAYNAIKQTHPSLLPFDQSDLTAIRPRLFKPATNYLTASMHVDRGLRDDLRAAYRESRSNGQFDRIWKEWYGDRDLPPNS